MFVFLSITFEDGYVFTIEKTCYDSDFESDSLVNKHGKIIHFHLILEC